MVSKMPKINLYNKKFLPIKDFIYLRLGYLDLAKINSIDSVGYFDNQNLYKLIDTLGVDSVLVFSVSPDSLLQGIFEYVGSGNGDYVLDSYNALGKVFRWIAPVAGVSQGDYVPSRSIITPKKQQMISSGFKWSYSKITPSKVNGR